MIRQRPELRKTPIYRMEYFSDGDLYYVDADLKRFQTIENQLDALLRITGGGILKGWEVYQENRENPLSITVSGGIGIIPFIQDKIDPVSKERIFDPNSGEVIKETYYIAIRTRSEINIENAVGLNRRSIVSVGLNPQAIGRIQSQDFNKNISDSELVDWDDFTEITISPSVTEEELPGKTGPYRNTTPDPGDIEFPIKNFIIDGDFNPNTQKAIPFVNGKPYYDGYSINGKTIIFSNPLHKEDVVVVRIEPLFGLVLAEIETDDNGIVNINSSIRVSAFTKSADSFIYNNLLNHKHTGDNSPEKILLTTETGIISSVSKTNNSIFTFNKEINGVKFSEYYGFPFDKGTYDIEIFINGFSNTYPVNVSDDGSKIVLEFLKELNSDDIVQILLYIKSNYTQIKNKLIVSQRNPSLEKIDIEVSGDSIKTGVLSDDLIPRLSHIGIYNEIMKPSNPESGEENVHDVECLDFKFLKEFFPVYREKTNARNSLDIFSEPKILPGIGVLNPSKQIIHVCGSDGILYKEVPFEENEKISETRKGFICGSRDGRYNEGWRNINFDLLSNLKEFDKFFKICPVKIANSPSSNNWDLIFLVSKKFVVAISWSNLSVNSSESPVPRLLQVLNTTEDIPSDVGVNNPYYSKNNEITGIVDASYGRGILNLEKTVYILAENKKVYCFDYSDNQYGWIDVTSSINWSSSASNIFSLSYKNEESSNDILFVGEESGLYFNSIGKKRIESTLGSGVGQIYSILFEPSDVWDNSVNKLVQNGDSLIFFGNRISEKKNISTVQYSTDSPYYAQISLTSPLSKTYPGINGNFYRSGFIKDWQKNSTTFIGIPKKAIFIQNRLFILTTLNLYVSDNEYPSIDDINYSLSNMSFSLVFSSNKNINDIEFVNGVFIIGADDGIYRLSFDYSLIPVPYSNSENSENATSINDILYPSNKIFIDPTISFSDNVVFSLGKYGVFQSTDSGLSWRNTLQLLGQPESKDFVFNYPKEYLKITGKDISKKRIYVIKNNSPYGYGYGYGYGEGEEYFDVFNFNSFNVGYGVDTFESDYSFSYGYGFGNEISDSVKNLSIGDWVYYPKNSGSSYVENPLKIIGFGIEEGRNYIEIEQGDGYPANFDQIPLNLIVEIYSKIEPLCLINGNPQSSFYEIKNIENYNFDTFRQSVEFDNYQNPDDKIEIASRYKSFSILENYDLNLRIEDKEEILLDGINLSDYYVRDGNIFKFDYSLNIDDILKITIKNSHIKDTGIYSHKDIEDKISLETVGLEYELDGVRTSNFLHLLMALKHKFKDLPSNQSEVAITVESIGASSGILDSWIQDTSLDLESNAYVGRILSFSKDNKNYKFTISSNTNNRIYIKRNYTYEIFRGDGITSSFGLKKGNGVEESFSVFKNGILVSDLEFSEIISGDYVVSVEFSEAPLEGDNIVIKYVDSLENFDISSLFYVGQSLKIDALVGTLTSRTTNIFVSDYREDEFIIDLDRSFVENEIYLENSSDIGKIDYSLFYIYSDSTEGKFYAGTDTGVWSRNYNSIIFDKTGSLLNTLNPIGELDLPEKIEGAYIEYNHETEEWVVTWGGSPVLQDINLDIDKLKINSVVIVNEKIQYAGTDRGLYRTLAGESNLECVWNTTTDGRTKNNPEIFKIVIDDKHEWILNAILATGIYRSYDYGNNWIVIDENDNGYSCFSYQKDSSDSRSVYYYGKDTIKLKTYELGAGLSSLQTVKEIKSDLAFGTNYISSSILKIENNTENVNEVYFGLDSLGVYKSELFGNAKNIYKNNFVNNNYGLTIASSGFSNIGIRKTGALNDYFSSEIYYSLYVSPTSNNSSTMLLQMVVNPSEVEVLENHKFCGHYAKLPNGNYYKIIDNYDRGPAYELDYFINKSGENKDFRILEFILQGYYEKNESIQGIKEDENSDDYWFETSYPFGDTLNTISISYLKESNGKTSRIKLSSLGKTVYAVKSTIWTTGITDEDETVLIVDYDSLADIPLEYLDEDSLKDYYIGNPENNILYRIYNSKVLTSTEQYYDKESVSPRGHLSLRIEKKDDLDISNWNFLNKTEDPYYIWHRYFGSELHNSWNSVLVDPSSVNPTPDFYNDFNYDFSNFNTNKIFNNSSEGYTYIVLDDIFESGKNQICVILNYEDELSTEYSALNSLQGFIIKNPSTNYEYEITASRVLVSGDSNYDSNYHRVICRLERYSSSYDSGLSIYSDGSFSEVKEDRIKLNNFIGLNDSFIKGSFVFFEKRPYIAFRVKEIVGDYIVVDSDNLNSLVENDDILLSKNLISERSLTDLIVTDKNEIFVSGEEYVYTDRKTGGKNWYAIFDGLEIDSISNIPFVKMNSIVYDKVGDYLYATSNSSGYEGIYVHKGNGSNIDFFKISINNDILFGKKLKSIDFYRTNSSLILLVGTDGEGLYKGISSGMDPVSSTWTWSEISFPEDNISSVKVIADQDEDVEVDRIWIGTEGSGIFARQEDDLGDLGSSWINNINSEILSKDINASEWRLWRTEGGLSLNSLVIDNENIAIYKTADSPGVSSENIFDWEKDYIFDKSLGLKYYILDSGNSNYITDSYDINSLEKWNRNNFVSQSSRKYHKFHSVLTSSVSNNEKRIESSEKGIFGNIFDPNTKNFFKMDFMFDYNTGESVYEEPFKHTPDKNSIIKILKLELSSKLVIVTDRDGVYISDSSERYLLPQSSSDISTYLDYGYDFNFDSFISEENETIEYPPYRYTNEDSFDFNENIKINRLFEKLFMFEVDQATQPLVYSDISSFISSYGSESLKNSYMVVSLGDISEVSGPTSNTKTFIVKSIEHETVPSNKYKIKLSLGRINVKGNEGNSFLNKEISFSSYGTIGSDWENNLSEISTYTKFFFIDAQKYQKLPNDGLPSFDALDVEGNSQLGIYVRDAVTNGFDGLYLACGSAGIYYYSDINDNLLSWTKLSGLDGLHIISLENNKSINSLTRILYAGTAGDGVYAISNESSPTVSYLPGLENHPHVWCLFIDSSTKVYAGTEHGGVYKLNGSVFERMDGCSRSKIFNWKTTGVPVNKGETVFDYSNNNKLLSFAYGCGIMVSRDRGQAWEQCNSGLKNYYVQDVAICSGSGNENVAYAATSGGGLFKCENVFSESSGKTEATWSPCSVYGLPETLNINEVAVGLDPNIVYIKCIVNDFSLKDIPYRFRRMNYLFPPLNSDKMGGSSSYSFNILNNFNFPENLKNNIQNYNPYFPYEYGLRKHVIYRSTDGGNTWKNVYDIELLKDSVSENNFKAENAIYGLEVVPGESNIIKFVSNYSIKYSDSFGNYSLNKMSYVTLSFDSNDNMSFSEKEIPSAEFRLSGISNVGMSPEYPLTEGFLSINPKNINEIFFTVGYYDVFDKSKKIPILYSDNNGDSWSRRNSLVGDNITCGFNTGIEFSTIEKGNIYFNISYLEQNSGTITIDGIYEKKGYKDESFYWDSLSDRAKIDNSFINIDFNISDSYGNENNKFNLLLDSDTNVRVFDLGGAILVPDSTNNPNEEYLIENCGSGEFLHRKTYGDLSNQTTSLKLNNVFLDRGLNVGDTSIARLKNLTSFKIPFNESIVNTILAKENLLINKYIIFENSRYKIAFHRVYDDSEIGQKYIEFILIGNAETNLSGEFSVEIDSPVYSNYNNKIYVSVNKGLSWVEVDSSFNFNGFEILSIISIPEEYIGDVYKRVFFAAFKFESQYKLKVGTIDDSRYDGGNRSPIVWTDIDYPQLLIKNIIKNGLSFVNYNGSQYLYITTSESIVRNEISYSLSGFLKDDWQQIFSVSGISYPLTVSSVDNGRMAFVSGNKIFVSKNSFFSEDSSYNGELLPINDSSSYSISKIIINPSGDNEDEILISVNNSLEFESYSAFIFSINTSEDTNELVISQGNEFGGNPFLPFSEWENRPVIFSENGINFPYSSKITLSQNNTIRLLPTLNIENITISYSLLTNKTKITGNLIENSFEDITDYNGNIFLFYIGDTEILKGRIPKIYSENKKIYIIFNEDITGQFLNKNIDLENNSLSLRVGNLKDIFGFDGLVGEENFRSYSIASSKPSSRSARNGIYLSKAFGVDWNQISISENEEFQEGCLGLHVNENNSINVVTSNGSYKKIFINDSWIPSENVKKVEVDSDGSLYFITDNGYSKVNIDLEYPQESIFNNFSFKNYKEFIIDENDIILIDENDEIYTNEKNNLEFITSEDLIFSNNSIKNINKVFKDRNNILWVATGSEGVIAITSKSKYYFGNSEISSSTVYDVYQDEIDRIWLALGEDGIALISYVLDNGLITNWTVDLYGQESGITGSVRAISQKNGLNYIAQGSSSPASVLLSWINNSTTYSNILLTRSRSNTRPNYENKVYDFNSISGSIFSVEEFNLNINGSPIPTWKIVAQTFSSSSGQSIATNSLVDKYILINSRESDSYRKIIANGLDVLYVERVAGESAITQSGKTFLIVEKIQDEESFVLFAGNPEIQGSSFNDTNVVNSSTYYYYLDFYNSSGERVPVDSKRVLISSTSQSLENSSKILVATSRGLFVNEYGPIPFVIKTQFNNEETINSMYVDTANSIYICSNNGLMQITDSGRLDLNKSDLFSDKIDFVSSKNMEVRNVVEGISQELIIATNIGISIKTSSGSYVSFISNDPDLTYRSDGSFQIKKWRPVARINDSYPTVSFVKSNEENKKYIISYNKFLKTENYGKNWNEFLQISEFVENVSIFKNSSGEIIDYIFNSKSKISSTGSDEILETFNFDRNIEYISEFDRSSSSGAASHIYLSEPNGISENAKLFVGVFDNRITEIENEIFIFNFASAQDVNQDPAEATIDSIGYSSGMVIQSIYSISEDVTNNILFAGGKDNILTIDPSKWNTLNDVSNSDHWKPLEIIEENDSENSLEYCYTSICLRTDPASIESETLLYATRSRLFGGISSDFVILRPYESDIKKRFTSVDLTSSFIKDISWIDAPGRSRYFWENSHFYTVGNHRGSILFVESVNHILVGGFDNKLFLIPFTVDLNSQIKQKIENVSLVSGRRGNTFSQFPIVSQSDIWKQIIERGYAEEYETNFAPRGSWGIKFLEGATGEEGYMSCFIFGQNQDNFKSFYKHTPENDVSYIYKSYGSNMMFWEPFIRESQPKGIIADFEYYNDELYACSIYGSGKENVGLFKIKTSEWEKQDRSSTGKEQQYFNVPINELSLYGENLLIPTLGFGLQKNKDSIYSDFASRFFTQYGVEYGRWNVTKITQDPNNINRVLVGTFNRGLIEGVYSTESLKWNWSVEQYGFEKGNITAIEILPFNSDIVLVGVKEDGLYRKNPETKLYEKIINGLSSIGDLNKIKVNRFVSNVENYVNIENLGNNIMIIRSVYENPKEDPTNELQYKINDEISNAQVVYLGSDNFSEGIFVDRDINLKSGIPYFYRIYNVESGFIYSERDKMTGTTYDVRNLHVEIQGDVFNGKNLIGRILVLNTLLVRPIAFEIKSHSYSVSSNRTTVHLVPDKYRVINQGNADLFDRARLTYRVESTVLDRPRTINPIWIIYKENGGLYNKIYYSNDNGLKWNEANSDLPSNTDIYDIEFSRTYETRGFVKHIIYLSTNIGVYRSVNDGVSWSKISLGVNGLPETSYNKVLVDTEDFKIIYATTSTGIVYRSIDFGNSWEMLIDLEGLPKDYSIISGFENSVFFALENSGINEFLDPVREEFLIQIDSDSKITNVTFDEFEMGDEIFTDSNTIIAKTYPKNDSSFNNFEKITFKVDDDTKYLTFKFNKKNSPYNTSEIRIGQDLVNPATIPFFIQNPKYNDGFVKINKIGSLGNGMNFVVSNKGVHTTSNNGETWQKLTNSFLPNDIRDLASSRNGEILLGTSSGLWGSDSNKENYRNIEQNGFEVNTIWESFNNGVRRIFRGGRRGLYITIERPISKTIITYSGDITQTNGIKFSWGDIVSPRDGGWSEKTETTLNQSVWARPSSFGPLQEYKGWDSALIIRYGPFSTFQIAENYSDNNLWAPVNGVFYSSGELKSSPFTFGQSAIFQNSTDNNLLLEETSNQLDFSGIQDETTYHIGGIINIGNFPNVNSPNNYPFGQNYPKTDFPIFDKVDANFNSESRSVSTRISPSGYLENFADIRAYEEFVSNGANMTNEELLSFIRNDDILKKQVLSPRLLSNKYYAYRVFPYRLIPDPTLVTGDGVFVPTPRYRAGNGDLVESYSFIVDIEKFTGSTRILTGISTKSGNWIVGTDNGLFYSTENGQNVIRSEFLSSALVGYKYISIAYTSSNVVLAVAVGNTIDDIRVVRNTSDFSNSNFDLNWEILNYVSEFLKDIEVNMIFNIQESENKIYLSTNKGIVCGEENGNDWKFLGRVGNLESTSGSKILGQEFKIQ